MTTYRLDFPPGMELLNLNSRKHRMVNARITRELRKAGKEMAESAGIPKLGKVEVTAVYYPPDNRRRDSPNVLKPSSKPIIDGFVDAGIIRDDNDRYVRGVHLLPGDRIVKGGQVVIEITEVGDEPA